MLYNCNWEVHPHEEDSLIKADHAQEAATLFAEKYPGRCGDVAIVTVVPQRLRFKTELVTVTASVCELPDE